MKYTKEQLEAFITLYDVDEVKLKDNTTWLTVFADFCKGWDAAAKLCLDTIQDMKEQ